MERFRKLNDGMIHNLPEAQIIESIAEATNGLVRACNIVWDPKAFGGYRKDSDCGSRNCIDSDYYQSKPPEHDIPFLTDSKVASLKPLVASPEPEKQNC